MVRGLSMCGCKGIVREAAGGRKGPGCSSGQVPAPASNAYLTCTALPALPIRTLQCLPYMHCFAYTANVHGALCSSYLHCAKCLPYQNCLRALLMCTAYLHCAWYLPYVLCLPTLLVCTLCTYFLMCTLIVLLKCTLRLLMTCVTIHWFVRCIHYDQNFLTSTETQ